MAGLLDAINNFLPEGGKPYRNLVFKGDTSVLTEPTPFTPMTQEDALSLAMGWSPMLAGINKLNVPSASIMDIIKNIKKSGGASVALKTGSKPSGGYMVAPSKTSEQMLPMSNLNKQTVEQYINQNYKSLGQPNNYLGAWVNPENAQVYLDVSKNIPSQFLSKNMAKKADQEAIWDLLNMREIRTK